MSAPPHPSVVAHRAFLDEQLIEGFNAVDLACSMRRTGCMARGQRNLPPSSLLVNRHRPVRPRRSASLCRSVGALRAEAEDYARERIGLQLLLHQRHKPVHPFAEVHRLGRHQHPDRSGRDQHSATHALTTPSGRPKTASLHRSPLLPTAENYNQNNPVLRSQTTVVTPWEHERQVRPEPRDFLQSKTCEEMDMKVS
jgi:hypothetical protein